MEIRIYIKEKPVLKTECNDFNFKCFKCLEELNSFLKKINDKEEFSKMKIAKNLKFLSGEEISIEDLRKNLKIEFVFDSINSISPAMLKYVEDSENRLIFNVLGIYDQRKYKENIPKRLVKNNSSKYSLNEFTEYLEQFDKIFDLVEKDSIQVLKLEEILEYFKSEKFTVSLDHSQASDYWMNGFLYNLGLILNYYEIEYTLQVNQENFLKSKMIIFIKIEKGFNTNDKDCIKKLLQGKNNIEVIYR